MDLKILELTNLILSSIDTIYTFILLFSRYAGFFLVVPGIGGIVGMSLRIPATILMAIASTKVSLKAVFPESIGVMAADIGFEFLMGMIIGFIPLMIVSGAALATQLASNMMGLNASNIIDPASGNAVGALTKIIEELMILVFLIVGGHYVLIEIVAGVDSEIAPGVFRLDESILEFLVKRVGHIFEAGVILSVPVVVSLLLTQFVMGLISKAVPSINIFIISFPITIGIGLILISMSLPEMAKIITDEFNSIGTFFPMLNS
ncbi:MAG: flagellar biosynthetic protein FliR [Bdellovibrionota bacterium]|nr:flagellar biosynthetic protein FliR [Pseudomonadota bacterium]MDY6090741.1 flagellar biosynthetic protein FliR [Bdellovibrionota bacterium]